MVKRALLLGLSMGLGGDGHAASSMARSCPDSFIGVVKEIRDDRASAEGPLKKVDVRFALADGKNTREIKALKNGEERFRTGETYRVGLREGFLCEVVLLSSTE